jgi:GTP-binding protein LepA
VRGVDGGRGGLPVRQHQDVSDARIGDTITDEENPAAEPLPGFEEIKPMVFAGLYPVEIHQHGALRDALEKLRLNDSAFTFEPESSAALGFRLPLRLFGLLHLEIVQERLEREFGIDLITTAPGVRYRVRKLGNGEMVEVDNPTKFPNPAKSTQGRGADYRGDGDHARGVPGRDPQAARGEAGQAEEVRVPGRGA